MSGTLAMLTHQYMLGNTAYSPSLFELQILIVLFGFRATFRVFKIERKLTGKEDLPFLERVFQKLLLNFTWLVAVGFGILCYAADEDCGRIGGSIVKIRMGIMSSREASLGSIILVHSIVRNRSLLVERYDKLMGRHGWRFIALICAFSSSCALRV